MPITFDKIRRALGARWTNFQFWLFRFISWRSPRLLIWLRWPFRKPWQRDHLRLATHGGVGDEMMATAVLREIKRRNPHCHLTFLSRRPELFRHLPYIDAVEMSTTADRKDVLFLGYTIENVVPPHRPIISLLGECVGLVMHATQLDRPQLTVSDELRARIAAIPAPRVVIQPSASQWTPNKNWPAGYWAELIKMLAEKFSVIEVGSEIHLPATGFGPRFHSFIGQTDLSGFAHIISQAAVFAGPVSGGMHLANAFEIPSVIIIGGYESPLGHQYPRSTMFHSPVPCSPCWLSKPCPYDLKCLKLIQPAAVFAAICHAAAGQSKFEVIESKIESSANVR